MGGRRIARSRGIVVDGGSAEVVYVCGSGGSAVSRLENTEWATQGRRGKGANSDPIYPCEPGPVQRETVEGAETGARGINDRIYLRHARPLQKGGSEYVGGGKTQPHVERIETEPD